MTERQFGLETRCLHAGQSPDPSAGSRAVPIHQTTSYVFESPQHAADLFNLEAVGHIYSRLSNPTTGVLEERIAALEGGKAALVTASGMSAQAVAVQTFLESGDEIVSASTLYGGTYTQFDVGFRRMGINTVFVDSDDPENFRKAITPKTKMLYAEVVGNPRVNILDISAVADIAHEAGIPLVVDNTIPSPYLCRPLEFGADIVIHSATKFLGGHGNSLGGVIVDGGRFPWDNGKFPAMTEPSDGYHGLRFHDAFGDMAFAIRARVEPLRMFGPSISPLSSFLLLQGVETLHLRMKRHTENALAVARYLQGHDQVTWVNYPGLEDSPHYPLTQKYLPDGSGAVLTFGLKGGREAGVRFIESCQILSHLANIGDAKTLVIHPSTTTHRQLDEQEQLSAGVTPEMVRISTGLESLDDIIWDIDQALVKSGQAGRRAA